MPTELALVAVLTHKGDDGAWWFMCDDDESSEKATRWGLPVHIRVACRWSLADYLGKRVVVLLRCSAYRFRTDGGAVREGLRATGIVNIKLKS